MDAIKDVIQEKKTPLRVIDIDNQSKKRIDNRFPILPLNEAEFVAQEIASKLDDLSSIRLHIKIVRELGPDLARDFLARTLEDVEVGKEKGKKIDNPAALFNWKVQEYKRQKGWV